jgi:hypothetical protein
VNPESHREAWEPGEVTRIENGVVELVVRKQGGHFAEFQFSGSSGAPSPNVLWESSWRHERLEGASPDDLAKTAGFTGHGLCLDYFGSPSAAEAARGFVQHGEAARALWEPASGEENARGMARWSIRLPVAQLDFERKVRLGSEESVVFIEETVTNLGGVDHICDWVQHATFGPPFATHEDTSFIASATRGLTAPDGYGADSLVASNREFEWPFAPAEPPRNGMVDLGHPFAVHGKGITAAVQMDPRRKVEFIAAINRKYRLGVGYCFRREDFPWMMVWEENCVRPDRPWHGTAQARGMEFGSTPLPSGREETLRRGQLFETPSWCAVPANGRKTARYLMFLFWVPDECDGVTDVVVRGDAIDFAGEDGRFAFSIPAHGCEEFLSASDLKLTLIGDAH